MIYELNVAVIVNLYVSLNLQLAQHQRSKAWLSLIRKSLEVVQPNYLLNTIAVVVLKGMRHSKILFNLSSISS